MILVGELRDLETMEAAITAAETGHLVFGTLHTTGAAKTIDRITNAFPTHQQEMVRIQSDIQTGGKYGMVTLDGLLMEKHMAGIISRDEVITKAQDVSTIVQKLAEWEAAQAEAAARQQGEQE